MNISILCSATGRVLELPSSNLSTMICGLWLRKQQDELGQLDRKIKNLLDFDCFEKDLEEAEEYSYAIS